MTAVARLLVLRRAANGALAGGFAGILCMALLELLGKLGFGAVYLTLWGIWYAVRGAVIAALPARQGNGT